MTLKSIIPALAMLSCLSLALPAQAELLQGKEAQHEPFRIVGNLYYVGSDGHGAYLISTPKGSILINSNYVNSPPLIRKSVEKLGFKWTDIKIHLISHAHHDHDAGGAQIVKETGAKYEVMQGDADVVEGGGKGSIHGAGPEQSYPPAKVDRVLHDGDTVELGGMVLTAHLTPGHTKGVTTWTFDEKQDGRLLHVVIIGGPALNRGMQTINNAQYPNIVSDYEKGFAVLHSLPCDIPLGAHDWYFNLGDKYKRFAAGDKNAFIDPAGYTAFIDKSQTAFEAYHKKQLAVAAVQPSGN